MKKLNKKVNTQIGTLEAYACGSCSCNCTCFCGSAPDSVRYGGDGGNSYNSHAALNDSTGWLWL